MNCQPLSFPRQWPDIRRRSLLLGIPLIGPQYGAYHDICSQLEARSAECWALWGPDPTRLEAAQFVAKTLAEAVEWPNPIFIPDDPLELLCWDHKSCNVDDLSLAGAFVEIEDHFPHSPNEEQFAQLVEGTFGGYVDFLRTGRAPAKT